MIVPDIWRRNTDSEDQGLGETLKVKSILSVSLSFFFFLHMKKLRFRDLSIVLEFVPEPGIDPRSPECFCSTSSCLSVCKITVTTNATSFFS